MGQWRTGIRKRKLHLKKAREAASRKAALRRSIQTSGGARTESNSRNIGQDENACTLSHGNQLQIKSKCFLCGNQLLRHSSSNPAQSDLFRNWKWQSASSICDMLHLDPLGFQQVFADGEYCPSCQELASSADFTTNAISRLQTALSDIEGRIRDLVQENYDTIIRCQGLSCETTIYDDDQNLLERMIQTIALKLEPAEAEKESYSTAPTEYDQEKESYSTDYDQEERYAPPEQILQNLQYSQIQIDDLLSESSGGAMRSGDEQMHEQVHAKKSERRMHAGAKTLSTRTRQKNLNHRKLRAIRRRRLQETAVKVVEAEFTRPCPRKRKQNLAKTNEELFCPHCDHVPGTESRLWIHLLAFHKEHLFKCPICWKYYESAEKCQGHELLHLSGSFHCILCGKPSVNPSDLIHHVQWEHDSARFWCNYESCAENYVSFSKIELMRGHLSDVHNLINCSDPYHCPACQGRYSRNSELQAHQRQSHGLQYKSTMNYWGNRSKRNQNSEALRLALRLQRSPKCSFCNKSFSDEADLRAHEALHSAERPFDCVICGDQFSTTRDLHRHVYNDHEELPYKCGMAECNARFASIPKLRSHWTLIHHHLQDKKYKCTDCNYQTDKLGSFKFHTLTHSKNRETHKCQVEGCGRAFGLPSNLSKHIRQVHNAENDKVFKCKICDKNFKDKSSLAMHEVRHGNLRPFLCASCPAAFKTKKDVDQHGKVHAKDKQTGFNVKLQQPRKARLSQLKNLIEPPAVVSIRTPETPLAIQPTFEYSTQEEAHEFL